MTSGLEGMNPDDVEALGRRLQAQSSELRRLSASLDRLVGQAGWVGPVAKTFKHSWWPQHRSGLSQAARDLDGFGQSALNNASEQRAVSTAVGGGGAVAALGATAPEHGTTQTWVAGPTGPAGWEGPVDGVQEQYRSASFMAELIDRFPELRGMDLSNLFDLDNKLDLPGALGAASFGIDVVQWVTAWDDQSAASSAWDGVGLAIDGVGVAVPQAGLAKTTWDLSYEAGAGIGTFLENRYDISGSFLEAVSARTGEVPTYEGVGGFFAYVGDGFQNAFSPKAWGF